MFIPYEVDAPLDNRPVANWLVFGGIILTFLLQVLTFENLSAEKSNKAIEKQIEEIIRTTTEEEATEKDTYKSWKITGPMERFVLNGWGLGLFTYIWLHGGIARGAVRLIGNLLFLWPFGNAVCAKTGNKLYLLVYLGFGVLAGIIHLLLGTNSAAGACGAISAIVGIYIVFFPENSISCFFLLPRPMAASISGSWVVLLWFIFDIVEVGIGGLSVTYYAHIICFGGGAGLAVLMLKKKWLVMDKDEKSLLQMLSKETEEKEEDGKKEVGKETKESLEAVDNIAKAPEERKAEPKKIVPEAVQPEDDFIRFRCNCGHKIKVRKKDAGKTGRCPKCSNWVEAPNK